MGFVGASIDDAVRYGAVAQESGFDPAWMTGEALYEALHRLAGEGAGGGVNQRTWCTTQ